MFKNFQNIRKLNFFRYVTCKYKYYNIMLNSNKIVFMFFLGVSCFISIRQEANKKIFLKILIFVFTGHSKTSKVGTYLKKLKNLERPL